MIGTRQLCKTLVLQSVETNRDAMQACPMQERRLLMKIDLMTRELVG